MGWGDDIMATGLVRVAQQTDPRRARVMMEKGPRWSEAYRNNPRIALDNEQGDFQLVQARANFLRPYTQAKAAQQWTWQPYRPHRGELYLDAAEQEFGDRHAGRVIVEPHIKPGASLNKQWGWVRWNKLAWLLGRRGIPVTQLGPAGTPVLEGAELVVTRSLRQAAAVLSRARAAVLPEGGLHHTAAVFDLPAVVIYGGFISPAVTGYEGQAALFVASGGHPLGCGRRQPCEHCMAAMASITPEQVADQLEKRIADQGMARPLAA